MSTINEIPYEDFPRYLNTVALITRVMKATRLNYSYAYDLVSADAPMDFASTADWDFEEFANIIDAACQMVEASPTNDSTLSKEWEYREAMKNMGSLATQFI